MGGSKSKAPKPSAEERELQKEQAETVRSQRDVFKDIARDADLLSPVLFEEIGLIPTFNDTSLNNQISELQKERDALSRQTVNSPQRIASNPFPFSPFAPPFSPLAPGFRQGSRSPVNNARIKEINEQIANLQGSLGKATGFTRKKDTTKSRLQSLEDQFFDRAEAALRGDLPVNPALLRQLDEAEETFNNTLINDFGSLTAARNSSAGQNRLQTFNSFITEQLENARRSDLTQATNSAFATVGQSEGLRNQFLQNATNVLNLKNPAAQGFGQAAGNFGSAVAPLQQQRQFETQFNASQPSALGSLGSIAGTAAGIAGGNYLGTFFGGAGGGAGASTFTDLLSGSLANFNPASVFGALS